MSGVCLRIDLMNMLDSTRTDWQNHMSEHIKFKHVANATCLDQFQIRQLSDAATIKSLRPTSIVVRDHTCTVFSMYTHMHTCDMCIHITILYVYTCVYIYILLYIDICVCVCVSIQTWQLTPKITQSQKS